MADYSERNDDNYGRRPASQRQGSAYRSDPAYRQSREDSDHPVPYDGRARGFDTQREASDARQARRPSAGYAGQQQGVPPQPRPRSQAGYTQQERTRPTSRDARQYADQQYEARRREAQAGGQYYGQYQGQGVPSQRAGQYGSPQRPGQYTDPRDPRYAAGSQRTGQYDPRAAQRNPQYGPAGDQHTDRTRTDRYGARDAYSPDRRTAPRPGQYPDQRDPRYAGATQRPVQYDPRDRRAGQYREDTAGRQTRMPLQDENGRSYAEGDAPAGSPGRFDGLKGAIGTVMPNMEPLSEQARAIGAALRQDRRLLIAVVAGIVLVLILLACVVSCTIGGNKEVVPAFTSTSAATTPVTSVSTDDQAQQAAQPDQTTQTAQQPNKAAADYSDAPECWVTSITGTDTTTQYNSGGVEDPWSPTGTFTTGDSTLDQYIKEYCDGLTDWNLDAGDNAYNVYLHISWFDYVERPNNQRPWDWGDGWRTVYAKQVFEEGYSANCYEFAAVIQYALRYFGYADAIAEPCFVLRQSGSYGDHGLVFVTSLDGRHCIIDASLSSNGWLLPANSMTYYIDDGYRA